MFIGLRKRKIDLEQYTLSNCVCCYDRARGSAVPKEPARNGILYLIMRAVMALPGGRVCDRFIKN